MSKGSPGNGGSAEVDLRDDQPERADESGATVVVCADDRVDTGRQGSEDDRPAVGRAPPVGDAGDLKVVCLASTYSSLKPSNTSYSDPRDVRVWDEAGGALLDARSILACGPKRRRRRIGMAIGLLGESRFVSCRGPGRAQST